RLPGRPGSSQWIGVLEEVQLRDGVFPLQERVVLDGRPHRLDALIEGLAGFPDGQTEELAGLGVTHRVDFLQSRLRATSGGEPLHGRDQIIDSLELWRVDGEMR